MSKPNSTFSLLPSTLLKPYPVMKDSGVEWLGEVPEHWGVRQLGHSIVDCVNGVWRPEANGIDDLECVRVADFDGNPCAA